MEFFVSTLLIYLDCTKHDMNQFSHCQKHGTNRANVRPPRNGENIAPMYAKIIYNTTIAIINECFEF